MAVLWTLVITGLLQSFTVDSQTTLTCQVNDNYVSCPPKACPGDVLTLTYNASYAVGSIVFRFSKDTCSNASVPDAIVVDQGATTCNGPSGSGSCGLFNATSVNGGSTMPCLAATLSIRVNSKENSSIPINIGTRTINGIENITTSTEIFLIKGPGYPHVSVNSGLTNLTVLWTSPSSGDSTDYYHVTLMSGLVIVNDVNVTSNQETFLNLSSNMLYIVQVAAINCASNSTNNSSAFTLSNPPSNIEAVKKAINGSGINLIVNWTHVGGNVVGYWIAPKCCDIKPLYAEVGIHCNAQNCSFRVYINIAENDLNFVTVSSVNSGGIGPESGLIKVTHEPTSGGHSTMTPVVVVVVVLMVLVLVVVVVVAMIIGLALLRRRYRNNGYYNITIGDGNVKVSTKIGDKSKLNKTGTEVHISLPLKSIHLDSVSDKEKMYLQDWFNKTMPGLTISDVSYIVNQSVLSKYVNRAKSIKKNCTDFSEQIVFRGTLLSDPKGIAEDGKGYGRDTKGSWGNGYYFSEDAKHAAQYAFKNSENKMELTVALIITGNCYKITKEEEIPPIQDSKGKRYDSCAGKRKSSKDSNITSFSYVVFSEDQICPLYMFSYIEQSSTL